MSASTANCQWHTSISTYVKVKYEAVYPDPVLSYSTYLGSCCDERNRGITVGREGNAYVTGWISSLGFPILNPLQPAL